MTGQSPLAPLAREAEIQRLLHVLVTPALDGAIAANELLEQVRAAAGRVPLLVGDHEARTHHVVVRVALAVLPAALPDPDAARGRANEAPAVVGKAKVSIELLRVVIGPELQLVVERIGVDDLARVHLPEWIEDRLQLAHRLHELGAEHLHEKRAARLSVAVLARERAAVGDDEVRRLAHEALERADTVLVVEIEWHATVDETHPEVAIERGVVIEALVERVELAEVHAETLGRDGGVLPSWPRIGLAGDEGGRAERALARVPELLLLVHVDVDARRHDVPGCVRDDLLGPRLDLFLRLAADLDLEPPLSLSEKREVIRVKATLLSLCARRERRPFPRA